MDKKVGKRKAIQFDTREWLVFVKEFSAETDRAAVILGAAKLDILLHQIIQKVLSPNTGSRDELLDGDSPLSTFSAKINLVYRLGIIDASLIKALTIVRKIRNTFAHETSGCNLESGAHHDRVKELASLYKPYPETFNSVRNLVKTGCHESVGESSVDFRTVLSILAVRLDSAFAKIHPLYTKSCTGLLEQEIGTDCAS